METETTLGPPTDGQAPALVDEVLEALQRVVLADRLTLGLERRLALVNAIANAVAVLHERGALP